MKARLAALCLLSLSVPVAHAVTIVDEAVDDTTLELTVVWDETFPGLNGMVADIFHPPWWYYQVMETDDTAVFVSSGGFDSAIRFGASRRFADAWVDSQVAPGYSVVVEAVPGNDFAAHVLATAPLSVPDGDGTSLNLLCAGGALYLGSSLARRSAASKVRE